jgi:hypothetical protein
LGESTAHHDPQQGAQAAPFSLRVRESFLYDPLGESLWSPPQGYRLPEGEYQRLSSTGEGGLISQTLGLELRVEEGRLRLVNPTTGERLLTPAEAQAARRAAEVELGRLRAELARLRGEPRSSEG